MSEPAMYGHPPGIHPSYVHPPSPHRAWRDSAIALEEPLSPLNPTFSGGESPHMALSGAIFGSLHEDYGPSPPGTGTSTSSNTPHPPPNTMLDASSPSNTKQYSFVPLPGNGVKKRPRRRYDEIERLYQCAWPNCTKAYGTLNHLNAHITMQKHGQKRSPNEFKELRKQWRKAKKEEAEAKALDLTRHAHPHPHSPQLPPARHILSDAEYRAHGIRPPFDYPHHSERSIQPAPLDDLHDPRHRSQRYASFAPPHPHQSAIAYPHPQPQAAHTPSIHPNRLPPNSTLLTPLPGYESSSMVPVPDFDAFNSYALYRDDTRSRSDHPSPDRHADRARTRIHHNWPPS